jgi:hypothetical protein
LNYNDKTYTAISDSLTREWDKTIHLYQLEQELNLSLRRQLSFKDSLLLFNSKLLINSRIENNLLKDNISDYIKIRDNLERNVDILNKQNRKEKLLLYGVVGVAILEFLVIIFK